MRSGPRLWFHDGMRSGGQRAEIRLSDVEKQSNMGRRTKVGDPGSHVGQVACRHWRLVIPSAQRLVSPAQVPIPVQRLCAPPTGLRLRFDAASPAILARTIKALVFSAGSGVQSGLGTPTTRAMLQGTIILS